MHAETEVLVRSIDIVNERIGGLEGRLSELERLNVDRHEGVVLDRSIIAGNIDQLHGIERRVAEVERLVRQRQVEWKVDPGMAGRLPLTPGGVLNEGLAASGIPMSPGVPMRAGAVLAAERAESGPRASDVAVAEMHRSAVETMKRDLSRMIGEAEPFGVPVLEQVDPATGLTVNESQHAVNLARAKRLDAEIAMDRGVPFPGTREKREGNAKALGFPAVTVTTGDSEVVGTVTLPIPCCGGEDQKRAVLLEAVHVSVRELHTKLVNEANEILRRSHGEGR